MEGYNDNYYFLIELLKLFRDFGYNEAASKDWQPDCKILQLLLCYTKIAKTSIFCF